MITLFDFDILNFLGNTSTFVQNVGSYVVVIAGFVMIIVAIVQIAKGLASGGKGQVNWAMSIGCLLVGGALAFGGWTAVTSIANGGQQTIQDMGHGTGSGDAGQTAGSWTVFVNGSAFDVD